MATDLSNADGSPALARRDCSALRRSRQQWIQKYRGHFGDPIRIDEYRAGTITFEELYRSSMHTAENMVAEAGSITADVLHDDYEQIQ